MSLSDDLMNSIRNEIESNGHEVECPKCHTTFMAYQGVNVCPSCKEKIDLRIEFD